ncbi:hypothetical protein NX059_000845 [Plenodomus lindquistii]|nr:hypothetical protein NX059_000845 [Plenodomus lindquistii]
MKLSNTLLTLGLAILAAAKKVGPDGISCRDCALHFEKCYETPECLGHPTSGCQLRCKKDTCQWKESCRKMCRYTECL